MIALRAGRDYPRSVGEFLSWFGTDADCRDYLAWLRWPGGFVCDECGHVGGWEMADGRWRCPRCSHRTSVTAGTIFDKTRTPLTVWFQAVWSFATAKDGISALGLQRTLQIGSYQTAWAMLHRLRSVLIRPGRELLSGRVEMDETYIGGEEAGLAGGRAKGKKSLVAVAVELAEPMGFGRCRMQVIPDASGQTLHAFVADNVATGSTVITDGWTGCLGIDKRGYTHDRRSQRAAKAAGEDVGRAAARRAPRRVAGQAVAAVHPSGRGRGRAFGLVLQEFCFRFNRRRSRSRGLLFLRVLQLAAGHDPVRYRQLIKRPRPRDVPPRPPGMTGHPPSIDRPRADRPWRRR